MFNSGDIVKYKNYEAVVVFKYTDGYTIRFRRGCLTVDRFCRTSELTATNHQMSLFERIK